MPLSPTEARVVGCLVEKQLATPQQYPLTLNALVLGCNQTSNRHPVMALTEAEVDQALSQLKEERLVRFVLPSHGRSVVRYRHVLDERWSLDPPQLAVLASLLLRGPETVGELRSRTERMARFDDGAEVEHTLDLLARAEPALVAPVPRQPGQKEGRWAQLLAPDTGAVDPAPAAVPAPGGPPADGAGDQWSSLRDQVHQLQDEVAELRAVVDDLRASLGG